MNKLDTKKNLIELLIIGDSEKLNTLFGKKYWTQYLNNIYTRNNDYSLCKDSLFYIINNSKNIENTKMCFELLLNEIIKNGSKSYNYISYFEEDSNKEYLNINNIKKYNYYKLYKFLVSINSKIIKSSYYYTSLYKNFVLNILKNVSNFSEIKEIFDVIVKDDYLKHMIPTITTFKDKENIMYWNFIKQLNIEYCSNFLDKNVMYILRAYNKKLNIHSWRERLLALSCMINAFDKDNKDLYLILEYYFYKIGIEYALSDVIKYINNDKSTVKIKYLLLKKYISPYKEILNKKYINIKEYRTLKELNLSFISNIKINNYNNKYFDFLHDKYYIK